MNLTIKGENYEKKTFYNLNDCVCSNFIIIFLRKR